MEGETRREFFQRFNFARNKDAEERAPAVEAVAGKLKEQYSRREWMRTMAFASASLSTITLWTERLFSQEKRVEIDKKTITEYKEMIERYWEALTNQIFDGGINKETLLDHLEETVVKLSQSLFPDTEIREALSKGGQERAAAIELECNSFSSLVRKFGGYFSYFIPDKDLGYLIVAGDEVNRQSKDPESDTVNLVSSIISPNKETAQDSKKHLGKAYSEVHLKNMPKSCFFGGTVIDVNDDPYGRIAVIDVSKNDPVLMENLQWNEMGNVVMRNWGDIIKTRENIDDNALYKKSFTWNGKQYEFLSLCEMVSDLVELKRIFDTHGEGEVQDMLSKKFDSHLALASTSSVKGYELIFDMGLKALSQRVGIAITKNTIENEEEVREIKNRIKALSRDDLYEFYFGSMRKDAQTGYYRMQGGLIGEAHKISQLV